MSLIGLRGPEVNRKLLIYAANHGALVIDAANAANPHTLHPEISEERFNNLEIIGCELLYKFRDILKTVKPKGTLIVTTFDHLFNYQDDEENHNVLEHAWELMKNLAKRKNVIVGVSPKQRTYAEKYCDIEWDIQYGANELRSTIS